MPATIDEVIAISKLPCSIIIIGVGNANFDAMEQLEGDGERLRNDREVAQRDIVQFVRFNDAVSRGDLAEQVLKEIPKQLLSYMLTNGMPCQTVQQHY